MTFSTCLGKVVKESFLTLCDESGNVLLREKGVMSVVLSDIHQNAAVVRLDKLGALGGLKDGKLKSVCDYAVVSDVGGTVRVLLIELKKTLTEEIKGLEQLRRSLPLVQYLRSVCEIECDIETENTETRYVLVAAKGNRRLDKQRVRASGLVERKIYGNIEIGLHIVGSHIGYLKLWHR